MVASSAAIATHMSDGFVAMQCSLVPSIASMRLHAGDRRAAVPGSRLLHGIAGIAEVHASRPLQQIAGSRRHVANLRRCAGEDRLRKNRIILAHRRMVRKIGIANRGADLQAAVGRRFNLVERQAVDVEQARAAFRRSASSGRAASCRRR